MLYCSASGETHPQERHTHTHKAAYIHFGCSTWREKHKETLGCTCHKAQQAPPLDIPQVAAATLTAPHSKTQQLPSLHVAQTTTPTLTAQTAQQVLPVAPSSFPDSLSTSLDIPTLTAHPANHNRYPHCKDNTPFPALTLHAGPYLTAAQLCQQLHKGCRVPRGVA